MNDTPDTRGMETQPRHNIARWLKRLGVLLALFAAFLGGECYESAVEDAGRIALWQEIESRHWDSTMHGRQCIDFKEAYNAWERALLAAHPWGETFAVLHDDAVSVMVAVVPYVFAGVVGSVDAVLGWTFPSAQHALRCQWLDLRTWEGRDLECGSQADEP